MYRQLVEKDKTNRVVQHLNVSEYALYKDIVKKYIDLFCVWDVFLLIVIQTQTTWKKVLHDPAYKSYSGVDHSIDTTTHVNDPDPLFQNYHRYNRRTRNIHCVIHVLSDAYYFYKYDSHNVCQ